MNRVVSNWRRLMEGGGKGGEGARGVGMKSLTKGQIAKVSFWEDGMQYPVQYVPLHDEFEGGIVIFSGRRYRRLIVQLISWTMLKWLKCHRRRVEEGLGVSTVFARGWCDRGGHERWTYQEPSCRRSPTEPGPRLVPCPCHKPPRLCRWCNLLRPRSLNEM